PPIAGRAVRHDVERPHQDEQVGRAPSEKRCRQARAEEFVGTRPDGRRPPGRVPGRGYGDRRVDLRDPRTRALPPHRGAAQRPPGDSGLCDVHCDPHGHRELGRGHLVRVPQPESAGGMSDWEAQNPDVDPLATSGDERPLGSLTEIERGTEAVWTPPSLRTHDTLPAHVGFWKRFRRTTVAVAAAVYPVLLILAAVLAGRIGLQDPNLQHVTEINKQPSGAHWFGQDDLGRDVFARIIYGARISLKVSFMAGRPPPIAPGAPRALARLLRRAGRR